MSVRPLRAVFREATSTALLDAAEAVMATDGVDGAALNVIAKRAGIAVGTIYNHFADKGELIDAMFARRREELFLAIDAVAKESVGASFEQQLEGFVRAVFSYFDKRREFLRLALETEHINARATRGKNGDKQPALQQLHDRAARIVRVGVREKRLREDTSRLLPTVLLATLKGVLVAHYRDETSLLPNTALVLTLFLYGASRK
jgi:AcrR family transcriptional regulator